MPGSNSAGKQYWYIIGYRPRQLTATSIQLDYSVWVRQQETRMIILFERSEFLIHTPQKKNMYRLYGKKRLHVERVFD